MANGSDPTECINLLSCIFLGDVCGFLSHQEFLSLAAASPSSGLAHGVNTSVPLSSEARRCLLRDLSGFCSAVLTSGRSAVCNVDEVFRQRDLSLVAVHKFPREVFCCTKNDVWSFAALHPTEQPSFAHVEFCAAKISHLCAYLESRKTLRYGGVQARNI